MSYAYKLRTPSKSSQENAPPSSASVKDPTPYSALLLNLGNGGSGGEGPGGGGSGGGGPGGGRNNRNNLSDVMRARTESMFGVGPSGVKEYEQQLLAKSGLSSLPGNGFLLGSIPDFHPLGQPQIPRAEEEADRLSASIRGDTPDAVKSAMGERLGADFSGVRFHIGPDAVSKADAAGARAYTTGSDVYFGEGGFDASVAAHELVHTAQQGAVASSAPVVSAPMGGIQRIPDFLKYIWRGMKKAGTAVKEFVGGKLGLLGPSKEEKAAANEKAQAGDYSDYARTTKGFRESLVAGKKAEIAQRISSGKSDEELRQLYGGSTTDMLNPVNREALSEMGRDKSLDDATRQRVTQLSEDMDLDMMVNTMKKTGDEQKQRLKEYYKNGEDEIRLAKEYERSDAGKTYLGGEARKTGEGNTLEDDEILRSRTRERVSTGFHREDDEAQALADADINRSQNASDALLNLMFLGQMGSFQKKEKKKGGGFLGKLKRKFGMEKKHTVSEWDQTMANAFSHGGRTGFVFNVTDSEGGADTDAVSDAIFGEHMGAAAGMQTRDAGTHHIETPTLEKGQLKGLKGYKEEGGIKAAINAATDRSYQHYGMDLAIGGIGQRGVAGEGGQGQLINADGRSGHLYVGKKSSTSTQAGGLLVGLESDSPYRMNQTGHMHNAAAQSEKNSSTGGMKADIKGDKYGGRTVDLTGVSNQDVITSLNAFKGHFQNLRTNNEEAYNDLLRKVAGKRMSEDEFRDFMTTVLKGGQEGDLSQENAELLERLMANRGKLQRR